MDIRSLASNFLKLGIVGAIAKGALSLYERRQRIKVGAHTAVKVGDANPKAFINVVNRSPTDVEVVRVWFEEDRATIEVANPERPLPHRLRPEESWETWCDLSLFTVPNVERLGRRTA